MISTIQDYDQELEFISIMKDLVQAEEEVSVRKMQAIRASVLSTRNFIDQISQTYNDLKSAYKLKLLQQREIKASNSKVKLPGVKKTKKSAVVLLSAEEKLSGEVNQALFKKFATYLKKNPGEDIVIAGKTGRSLYQQSGLHLPYRYFNLPEVSLSIESLRPVINFLLLYKNVNVFYGKFISFVRQDPTSINITGESLEQTTKTPDKDTQIAKVPLYIFEPSLEEILQFFETQIFTSFFKQVVDESLLAQIGSRIMSLEQSSNRINEKEKKMTVQRRKIQRQISNSKALQALAGYSIWFS